MSILPVTMAPLEYQKEQGREARAAILSAVLAMEREGKRSTTRAIGRRIGLSHVSVGRHCRTMETAGLVTITRGRYGRVELTEAGKLIAK